MGVNPVAVAVAVVMAVVAVVNASVLDCWLVNLLEFALYRSEAIDNAYEFIKIPATPLDVWICRVSGVWFLDIFNHCR
jgi:hypothetical protein